MLFRIALKLDCTYFYWRHDTHRTTTSTAIATIFITEKIKNTPHYIRRERVYTQNRHRRERKRVWQRIAAGSSSSIHIFRTHSTTRLRLRYDDERRAKQEYCILYGEFLVNFVVEGSTQCCVLSISFETSRCLATSLFSSTQKVQRVLFSLCVYSVCDIWNKNKYYI